MNPVLKIIGCPTPHAGCSENSANNTRSFAGEFRNSSFEFLKVSLARPEPQNKEPSARSELAVIQPLWPSVDLLIYNILLIRVLEYSKILNQYIC